MEPKSERVGDVIVLSLGERLDVENAPVLEEAVQKVFDGGIRNVILEFSNVTYISSVGLSACLLCAKQAQETHGRAVLVGMTEPVAEVFKISGLINLFSSYTTRDEALLSYEVEPHHHDLHATPTLTLPEEILLLALHDDGSGFAELPEHSLEYALSGAVLMNLSALRLIENDLRQLKLIARSPIGDDIFDPALTAIGRADDTHDAQWWIHTLAREADAIRERSLDRLIGRGILSRDQSRLRWVLGKRRYPILDETERKEAKERVLAIIKSDEIPDPHDVSLIALAEACAVFDAILTPDDMIEYRPRIQEIAKMDLLAQSMANALGARRGGEVEGEPHERIYDAHAADGARSE